MHSYEEKVLLVLEKKASASLEHLIEGTKLGKDQVIWALDGLRQKGFAELHYDEKEEAVLTDEGKVYAADGLPEEQLLKRLGKKQMHTSGIHEKTDQIGLQWLRRKGLVDIENGSIKANSMGLAVMKEGFPEARALKEIAEGTGLAKIRGRYKGAVELLEKRGLASIEKSTGISHIEITQKGREAAHAEGEGRNEIGAVDRNMIVHMGWKGKNFSPYNVEEPVERAITAKMHVLQQTIEEIKDAYSSMGFREISGPTIEPSFWVFDSLFMPQDHPARDKQDTFYLSNPKEIEIEEKGYVGEIKAVHERAWRHSWELDKAKQAVLRTHTTSVSARFIHQAIGKLLSKESKERLPIKAFSVGRMFRNENVDYKHLADFYQHDGIIIGKDLTLANLFDTLIKLYGRLGIKLKFKPSYFPFV